MKASESKTTTAANPSQAQKASQPFFNKGGEGSFFSKEAAQPDFFFSPSTIQPKLTIGAPNDPYEQEADAMAEKVVQRLSVGSSAVGSPQVQMKCAACEEEEKVQKKEAEEEEVMPKLQRKAIFESNEEPPKEAVQRKVESRASKAFSIPAVTKTPASVIQRWPWDNVGDRAGQRGQGELDRRVGGSSTHEDGSGEWGGSADSRGMTDYANHYMWGRVALAAEALGLTNAARHMRHYLGNTGNALTVNVNQMLRDVPSFQEAANELAQEARTETNRRIAAMGDSPIATTFRLEGARSSDVYCSKSESQDWFYAVGGFTHWYTADVTITIARDGSIEVEMVFRIHMHDTYNWDHGKSVTIGPLTVTDDQMGRLHRVGLAREFEVNGTSSGSTSRWVYDPSETPSSPIPSTVSPAGRGRGGRADPTRSRDRAPAPGRNRS